MKCLKRTNFSYRIDIQKPRIKFNVKILKQGNFSCLFVYFSGRPPRGEVDVPWPQSLEFCLKSKGLAFSNAPFPGQAWGTNLVLLPYAGGQPNTTPAVI